MHEKSNNNIQLWTKNFIIITLLNFLIFFSFQMLQPTLPIYVKELGGTDSVVGLVTGIFTVSALIARPFAGKTLDKIGRKPVFIIGLAIFAASVLAYSWLPIIGLILFFRLIHGFGWGISNTAVNTIASDNIPKSRFGEGMGYFSLASSLAMAIAPAVGLSYITKYSFSNLFLIASALIITVLLLVAFSEYTKPKKTSEATAKTSTKDSLYEKSSIRPSIVIFFVCTTYGAVVSFISLYATEKGIENIGLFFTVYAVSLLVSRPVFGHINDRFGPDFSVIPGLIMLFIAMLLLWQASVLIMFLLVGCIYGIGFGAVQATIQTMAVAHVPTQRRGAANATFFTGFDSGIGFGSIIFGMIASALGYSNMYMLASAAIVIAFIFYVLLAKKSKSFTTDIK